MFALALPILYLRARCSARLAALAPALCASLITVAIGCALGLSETKRLTSASAGFQDTLYDKPYTRMAPYFLGTLMAFAHQSPAWRDHRHSRRVARSLSWGAAAAMLGVIFVAFRAGSWWSAQGSYWYTAASRLVFGAALGCLLWLCITGQNEGLNWALSLQLFSAPAKLTYSAYLVHPIIIRMYYYQRTVLIHYSALEHLSVAIAMAVYAYVASLLLNLEPASRAAVGKSDQADACQQGATATVELVL